MSNASYEREPSPLRDFTAESQQLFLPSELYHENSKLHPSDRAAYMKIALVNTSPEIRQVITRPFTDYPGCPRIQLPRQFRPSPLAFEHVIEGRRSVRGFSGAPIDLETLAKILYLGDGITATTHAEDGTDWLLRSAPSGGGLFPVGMYCIALQVDGLAPGLYFYNVREHSLQQVAEIDLIGMLRDATYLEETIDQASACVVLSAVMPRIRFKYGERAYRFVLLEAGHIAQNLLLAAHAEGLGGVPIGGFMDHMVNDALHLDGCDEIALYLILLGHPAPPNSTADSSS